MITKHMCKFFFIIVVRYSCEVVFSRASLHKLCKGILKYDHLQHVTDAAHCGHFNAQLMKPIMEPACWSEFVNESCDDPKYPVPLDLQPQILTAKNINTYECSVISTLSVSESSVSSSSDSDSDSDSDNSSDSDSDD